MRAIFLSLCLGFTTLVVQAQYTLHPPGQGGDVHRSGAFFVSTPPAGSDLRTNPTVASWNPDPTGVAPVKVSFGPDFYGASSYGENYYDVRFGGTADLGRRIQVGLSSDAAVLLPNYYGSYWYKPDAFNNFSFVIVTGNEPVHLYVDGSITYIGEPAPAGGEAVISVRPVVSAQDISVAGPALFSRSVNHLNLVVGGWGWGAASSALKNWVTIPPNTAHMIMVTTHAWRNMESVRLARLRSSIATINLAIHTRSSLVLAIARAIAQGGSPFLAPLRDGLEAMTDSEAGAFETLLNPEAIALLCQEGLTEFCEADTKTCDTDSEGDLLLACSFIFTEKVTLE